MNCADIARIADTESLRTLTAADRRAVEAHALACRDCAVIWSAHVQLAALATPPMPPEVSLRLQALAGLPAQAQRRYPLRRLTVVGGLVALAAAAGVLTWRLDGSQPEAGASSAIRSAPEITPGPAPATVAGAPPESTAGLECMPAIPTRRNAAPASLAEFLDRLIAELMKPLTEWQQEAEFAATREHLLASSDSGHLVAAALMTQESAGRMAALTRALATGGDNPVLVWTAARFCAKKAPNQDACPADALSERLLAIDPLNSESWMFAAVRRLKRGDEAGALEAVQRAAAAAESRIYFAETVALGERAYAYASDAPFAERVVNAIGLAAGNLPGFSDYTRMCTTRSPASQAWAQACLGYGELAEHRGDTLIGESFARSLQIAVLGHVDDPARLAAVVKRQELARAERADPGAAAEDELLTSTPALLASYLDVLAQQGETAARRWLRAEVARLRARLPACASR